MAGNKQTLITRRGMVSPMMRQDDDGEYVSEPFTYSIPFTAVTGLNPSFSGTIQIQADARIASDTTTANS